MEGQKSVVGRLEGQSLSSVGWKVKSLSVSHRWNGRSKVCQESLAGTLGWSFARMRRRKFGDRLAPATVSSENGGL